MRKLGAELQEIEDRAVFYRSITGWTCFEVDLDAGRRERAARSGKEGDQNGEAGAGNPKAGLGLGVRIDTFAQGGCSHLRRDDGNMTQVLTRLSLTGTFQEAFYLIFAHRSQSLHLPTFLQSTLASNPYASSIGENGEQLILVKHTIPPFVPVQSLIDAHLKPGLSTREAQDMDGEAGQGGPVGGFAMLEELTKTEGFEVSAEPLLLHAALEAHTLSGRHSCAT